MTTGTPDNVCVVDVTACESDEKAREVMVLQLLAAKRILRGILELIPSVFMNEVQSQDVFDLLKGLASGKVLNGSQLDQLRGLLKGIQSGDPQWSEMVEKLKEIVGSIRPTVNPQPENTVIGVTGADVNANFTALCASFAQLIDGAQDTLDEIQEFAGGKNWKLKEKASPEPDTIEYIDLEVGMGSRRTFDIQSEQQISESPNLRAFVLQEQDSDDFFVAFEDTNGNVRLEATEPITVGGYQAFRAQRYNHNYYQFYVGDGCPPFLESKVEIIPHVVEIGGEKVISNRVGEWFVFANSTPTDGIEECSVLDPDPIDLGDDLPTVIKVKVDDGLQLLDTATGEFYAQNPLPIGMGVFLANGQMIGVEPSNVKDSESRHRIYSLEKGEELCGVPMWIQTLNLKRTNTKSEESEEQIPVTFFLWSIGNRNSRCYVEVVSNKGKIIHLDKALDSGTKWQQVGNSFPHLDVRDSGKTVELKSACRKWGLRATKEGWDISLNSNEILEITHPSSKKESTDPE